jgi:hypothetical protein
VSLRYLNKDNWTEIQRGFIFEAIMFYPSDTKRPLTFFIPDAGSPDKGSAVQAVGNFNAQKVNGIFQAVEQKAIVTLKPRKVVILSNDVLNQEEEFEFIQVAPIMSLTQRDKSKDWFKMVQNDTHPIFVYLDSSITGKECYVDLSETMSIHKGTLLRKLNEVPEPRLTVIEEHLAECLSLGYVEEEDDVIPIDEANNF